jgi:hypothetical protein
MNSSVRIWEGEKNLADEIELTDAELAAISGADEGEDGPVPQTVEAPEVPVRRFRHARRTRPAKLAGTPPASHEQGSENVTSEEEEKLINLLLDCFVNNN